VRKKRLESNLRERVEEHSPDLPFGESLAPPNKNEPNESIQKKLGNMSEGSGWDSEQQQNGQGEEKKGPNSPKVCHEGHFKGGSISLFPLPPRECFGSFTAIYCSLEHCR
jgi:hypothetical protein